VIQHSFNKVKSDFDEESVNALKKVEDDIEKSHNREAAVIFEAFIEELQKPEPRRAVLHTLWSVVTTTLSTSTQRYTKPTVTQRYTNIEFPQRCYINIMAALKIQLTIESSKDTILEKLLSIPLLEGSRESILAVHVTAPAFKVAPPLALMRVPVSQDSDIVVFELMPVEAGRQMIEIEMFFRAERVGYFTFESEVVSNG
jgi:hypothetical protein